MKGYHILKDCEQGVYSFRDGDYLEALDMAIKALEQRPILDKIRAEVKHLRSFRAEDYDLEYYYENFDARIVFMGDVLQILDKYKAESEEN